MSYYTLTTSGTSPVDLAEMRLYMKIPASITSEDALIQVMIDACTEYGQRYTGREFTANTWNLLIDCLSDRVRLIRSPIDTITSIKHLVDDVLTVIPSTDYYKKDLTQWSEILLEDTKEWPTNTDDKEHAIEIIFQTKAYSQAINLIEQAIKVHVTYWFNNRGDCADCDCAGKLSGADGLYNLIRIPRI